MDVNKHAHNVTVESFLRAFDKGIPSTWEGDSQASLFEEQRYLVLRNLVRKPLADLLHRYSMSRRSGGTMLLNDEICPGTPSAYADPVMEELLFQLLPSVEFFTGLPVYPTYAYFRVYRSNDKLARHSDRAACEISLTLNLGYSAPAAWPIFLDVATGQVSVSLEPGDAVLYRGIELYHWREPFVGKHSTQVFLHYVDQKGPHMQERFDRRPNLNRLADVLV